MTHSRGLLPLIDPFDLVPGEEAGSGASVRLECGLDAPGTSSRVGTPLDQSPLSATLAALMADKSRGELARLSPVSASETAPRTTTASLPELHFSPLLIETSSLARSGSDSTDSTQEDATSTLSFTLHPDGPVMSDENWMSGHRKRARRESLRENSHTELRTGHAVSLRQGLTPNALFKEGFTYTLDAPTSALVREGEDSLTYLNKDQFYGLTLEYHASNRCPLRSDVAVSIIMLQFREKKEREEAVGHWRFWQMRQHSPKMRLLDLDLKNSSGVLFPVNEVAHNAVMIRWRPLSGPAVVQVAVRCLSTDFSSQKGVKGIPLHVQVDTYEGTKPNNLVDRAFCQIKTFCDKGAERKAREEERRMARQSNGTPNPSVLAQPQSIFQRAFDLVTEPVLYDPKSMADYGSTGVSLLGPGDRLEFPSDMVQELIHHGLAQDPVSLAPGKIGQCSPGSPALIGAAPTPGLTRGDRVMLYVRQDEEEILTPVHVVPPTALGLIRAISAKYVIDPNEVRFLFRRTHNDLLVKMDDDMIRHYVDGDVFILKVLSTRDIATGKEFFDIILEDVLLPTDEHSEKTKDGLASNSETCGARGQQPMNTQAQGTKENPPVTNDTVIAKTRQNGDILSKE